MLLAYFSQPGHPGGDAYARWLLDQMEIFYSTFHSTFVKLWNENASSPGANSEVYRSTVFPAGSEALKSAMNDYMHKIFLDSIGFAGMKMIRRVVGIAHVADLENIKDADLRSDCEKRALSLARELVLCGAGVSGYSSCDPWSSGELKGGFIDLIRKKAEISYSSPAPRSWSKIN
jgi:5-methylthioribose kinase